MYYLELGFFHAAEAFWKIVVRHVQADRLNGTKLKTEETQNEFYSQAEGPGVPGAVVNDGGKFLSLNQLAFLIFHSTFRPQVKSFKKKSDKNTKQF